MSSDNAVLVAKRFVDLIKKQILLVEKIAQHEEAIAILYKLFSKQFLSYRQFWSMLSLEELVHGSWIRRLYPQVTEGKIKFDEHRFVTRDIEKSLSKIRSYTISAKKKKMSLRRAIEIALELEDSVIESRFFSVYKAEKKLMRQLIEALSQAYIEHRNRLKKTLEELK